MSILFNQKPQMDSSSSSTASSSQPEFDYLFKLLLIGDSSVGKSCLLLRFAVRKASIVFISFFL